MTSQPGPEVQKFQLGPCAFRQGQEEQRLDDLTQAGALCQDPFQDLAVLLSRAIAAERDLDLAEQGRQGRMKLVRRIAGEPPLPVMRFLQTDKRVVQTGQQIVEGVAQFFQLIAGAWCRESLPQVGRGHRGGDLGHAAHGCYARDR